SRPLPADAVDACRSLLKAVGPSLLLHPLARLLFTGTEDRTSRHNEHDSIPLKNLQKSNLQQYQPLCPQVAIFS
ncbi:unnamed protein product, partial [Amoebophrya sp. A120]